MWGLSKDLHILEGDEQVARWQGTPEEFRERLNQALAGDSQQGALAVLRQRGGAGFPEREVARRRAVFYRDLGLPAVSRLFRHDPFPLDRRPAAPARLPA